MLKTVAVLASTRYLSALVIVALLLAASYEKCASQPTYTNVAPQKGVNNQNPNTDWGGGIGFFDYDKDGEDDLTYADSLHFYTNDTGSLTKKNFVKKLGTVGQALWLDFDNDGDNDLFVGYRDRQNVMYENTGNMTFRKMTNAEIDLSYNNYTFGISACDYNKDGYLDIYVANYEQATSGKMDTSRSNKLYRNNGNGTFTEVGVKAGVYDSVRTSFQGIWIDYNDDGWQDLYVINDLLPANSLYRNNKNGTFTEVTAKKNVGFGNQHPMSATAGDIDNNGALDIYMSNTYINNNIRDGMFLKNDGKGNYVEKAQAYGINFKKWSWGCTWVDYNNDSYQDLYITTANLDMPYPLHENRFYENNMGDTFTKKQTVFVDSHQSRSFAVAKGDLTGNGYYDLYVQGNRPENSQLWKNSGGKNHYIKITLEGTTSNRMAIGSWIHVYVDTHSYHKYTKCGQNYSGQNSQHKIFGLDTATKVDSVVVEYLSGFKDKYVSLPVDTHYYFKEGETKRIKLTGEQLLCQQNDRSKLTVQGTYDSLRWNNNDTGSTTIVSKPGKYWVEGFTPKGIWVQSDTFEVKTHPKVTTRVSHIQCHGDQNGSIQLKLDSLSRQLNPSIRWNNRRKQSFTLDSLKAGSYRYTYTDSTGCRIQDTIRVQQPAPLNIQTSISFHPNKTDSAAQLSTIVNGGTTPYRQTLNGKSITSPVKNLPVDTYRYQVKDTNGCTRSKQVVVNRDSVPPIQAIVQPVTCAGASDGSIYLQIDSFSGRKFQIRWKNGYRGLQVSGIPSGQYVYRYSDNEGAQYTDTVRVTAPDSLSLNPVVSPQTLTGLGRIKIAPSGGTPPYTININGREVDSTLDELEAGTYPVTVTDSQGCTKTRTVTVNDQRVPTIKVNKTPVSCHDGADGVIRLRLDSLFYRSRNFTIQWQDGTTGTERQGLSAGSYPFRYQDQKGIVVRDTVSLTDPRPVRYRRQTSSAGAAEDCRVNISITGGTKPYTIQWDSGFRANPVTDVKEGRHHLKVTDRNNCTLDTSITISETKAPEIKTALRPASCAGSADGAVSLRLQDSRDISVRIMWADGYEGKERDSLQAGNYPYKAVTPAGCRYQDTATVTAPFELDIQYQLVRPDRTPTATIKLVINGGTRPYTTYLDGVSVVPPIDSVGPGAHTLTVQDARQCRKSRTIEIAENKVTGLAGTDQKQALRAYPVPVRAGQPLELRVSEQQEDSRILKVMRTAGSVVAKRQLSGGRDHYRLNTTGWTPGVYLLYVVGQQQHSPVRITVYD